MGADSQQQSQRMLADAVEENLKKYANRNRVRFREFFRDFDKRRSNEISDAHFRTGLSYIKVTFTELELQALANKYRSPSSGRVRYNEFCDSIETVFTTKNLERMPTCEVPSIVAEAYLGPRSLGNDADEMDLMELMERIRERVRIRRLQIKPTFQDYDRKAVTKTISKFCHRVGTVTKAQFKQGLAIALSSMTFTEREYDMLCRRFDENGDVNYVAFAEEIDADNMVNKTMPATGISTISELQSMRDRPVEMYQRFDTFRSDDALLTHDNDTVMIRIKSQAYKNRLRVHEFFRDYDKLRNGTVTIPQFRIVLDMLKIRITDQEFEDLSDRYRALGYPNHVLWTIFADEVDGVFTQKGQERAPTRESRGPPEALFATGTQQLTVESEIRCADLLDVLKETARLRAVNIKAYFQDYDRGLGNQLQNLYCHKLSHVTRAQFREAIQMLFPTLMFQPEDYELLCDKYDDLLDGSVNYEIFANDVDPPQDNLFQTTRMFSESLQISHTSTRRSQQDPSDVDINVLLLEMQGKVIKFRLRVSEFFQDYDKLRSGLISKAKFRTALETCKYFSLSSNQLFALENFFTFESQPDKVMYMRFIDIMDAVFTCKDLEKMPTVQVQTPMHILHPEVRILEPDKETLCNEILYQLAERVHDRRILVKPFFQDYDRKSVTKTISKFCHRVGFVTKFQFMQACRVLFPQVDFQPEHFQVLFDKFGSDGDVNYLQFCSYVDPVAGHSMSTTQKRAVHSPQ